MLLNTFDHATRVSKAKQRGIGKFLESEALKVRKP